MDPGRHCNPIVLLPMQGLAVHFVWDGNGTKDSRFGNCCPFIPSTVVPPTSRCPRETVIPLTCWHFSVDVLLLDPNCMGNVLFVVSETPQCWVKMYGGSLFGYSLVGGTSVWRSLCFQALYLSSLHAAPLLYSSLLQPDGLPNHRPRKSRRTGISRPSTSWSGMASSTAALSLQGPVSPSLVGYSSLSPCTFAKL